MSEMCKNSLYIVVERRRLLMYSEISLQLNMELAIVKRSAILEAGVGS